MKDRFLHTTAAVLCTALAHSAPAATFEEDVAFLKNHTGVIVLSDLSGRTKVAVAPAWQGRVMTSTNGGETGASFGWLNRELIQAGKLQPHINAYGGEDRFWLGPEGGQFSLFFAKGAPFDLDRWQTPAAIDTMPYTVVSQGSDRVKCTAQFALANLSGTLFELRVDREVRLLAPDAAWKLLGIAEPEGMSLVAYESENTITNAGREAWKADSGLLSIWILGMFKHSPATTIVVPIKPGSEAELGIPVTSDYFGSIPADRIQSKEKVIYFKGDGAFRSKIGISPKRSKGVLGSYAADSKVLTILQFTQPEGVTEYVNSQWKIQDHPYGGDAANSYNDGPPAPGAKPLGPFYEMESSSPAAALSPGQALTHEHRTIHLSGSELELDAVARKVLGVSLEEIRSAFKSSEPAGARRKAP